MSVFHSGLKGILMYLLKHQVGMVIFFKKNLYQWLYRSFLKKGEKFEFEAKLYSGRGWKLVWYSLDIKSFLFLSRLKVSCNHLSKAYGLKNIRFVQLRIPINWKRSCFEEGFPPTLRARPISLLSKRTSRLSSSLNNFIFFDGYSLPITSRRHINNAKFDSRTPVI